MNSSQLSLGLPRELRLGVMMVDFLVHYWWDVVVLKENEI